MSVPEVREVIMSMRSDKSSGVVDFLAKYKKNINIAAPILTLAKRQIPPKLQEPLWAKELSDN